jgi:hypothetical protein
MFSSTSSNEDEGNVLRVSNGLAAKQLAIDDKSVRVKNIARTSMVAL